MDALNQGLDLCRGDVFLRMDADDIMLPSRVSRQISHLREVDVSFCRVAPFGHAGDGRQEYFQWQNSLVSHDQLKSNRFVECPFQHPTLAMSVERMRRLGGYRSGEFPEDYDLFLRMLEAGLVMEKLPDPLLQYRCSEDQLSYSDERYSKAAFHDLRKFYIQREELQQRWENRPLVVWGASRSSRRRFEEHFPGCMPDYYVDIKPSLIERGGQSRPRKQSGSASHRPVRPPDSLFQDEGKPFVLVYVNARGARPLIQSALAEHGFRPEQDYLCIG